MRKYGDISRFEIDSSLHSPTCFTTSRPLTNSALSEFLSNNLPDDRPFWNLRAFAIVNGTTELISRCHPLICDGVSLARDFAENVVDDDTLQANTRLSRPRKLNPDLLQLGTQPTLWQGVSRPIRDLFAELVHPLVQDPPSFHTYSEYGQSKKVSDLVTNAFS